MWRQVYKIVVGNGSLAGIAVCSSEA